MILDGLKAGAIAQAAQALKRGELVGLPTETVYGLGADAANDAAIAKIFKAKGRPADHPLIVHVLDADCATHFAEHVPDFAQRLMQAFWPGPLTLILPRREGVAAAAAGGQNSIGLRCPSHPVAQALLKACRKELDSDPNYCVWGIAAPSANQFGRVSPTTAQHVQSEFDDSLLILDGGPCTLGIESTIVDCTRAVPVLLRPGAIGREQVQAACGCKVYSSAELVDSTASAPRASGTLASHYAPRARVRLMPAAEMQMALDVIGPDPQASKVGGPSIATYSRAGMKSRSRRVLNYRMPADAAAAAQQLFAVLRELDDRGVKLIWIETPPDTPEWDAVRDRLLRAAAEPSDR